MRLYLKCMTCIAYQHSNQCRQKRMNCAETLQLQIRLAQSRTAKQDQQSPSKQQITTRSIIQMIQCSGRRRLRVELKFACAGCALMGLPQPPNKSEHARNSTQEQAFSASCKRSGESSKHSQARILTLTIDSLYAIQFHKQDTLTTGGNVATHMCTKT